MNQDERAETFGQLLLGHVEMCYSAAVVLTRDPSKARELTREAVTQTWHLRDNAHDSEGVKITLLTVLKEKYLQRNHQHTPESSDVDSSVDSKLPNAPARHLDSDGPNLLKQMKRPKGSSR